MLTVEFIGICTHVLVPIRGWRHRIVLPIPYRSDVPPHTAELLIPRDAVSDAATEAFVKALGGAIEHNNSASIADKWFRFLLKGVELTISNARGGYGTDEIFDCAIFKLTQMANGEELGAPNHIVAVGRDRLRANAYFNVSHGSFTARMEGESSAAVLKVETSGDPLLQARSFENLLDATLPLPPDTTIVVQHTVPHHHGAEHDDDRHFLLHYEAGAVWPAIRRWPTVPRKECFSTTPGEGLGPGCSNSTFP